MTHRLVFIEKHEVSGLTGFMGSDFVTHVHLPSKDQGLDNVPCLDSWLVMLPWLFVGLQTWVGNFPYIHIDVSPI